jgi:4-hydroxy-tetrahydrodipicolinate reductase
MEPIKVMVNGLPGNMASLLASYLSKTEGFKLVQYSLTGPEIIQPYAVIEGLNIKLLPPASRNYIEYVAFHNEGMLVADFTHPDAVIPNAQLYKNFHVPFIMGTTGGDVNALLKIVEGSDISAVIAPNMAAQIVVLMAMFDYAAATFPSAFNGYGFALEESHQAGKADTSGTMKEMLARLNELGVDCSLEDIRKVREPEKQLALGVPEEALGGHAYHRYTLFSPDGTNTFEFQHNVIGRDIYALGALRALKFLRKKAILVGIKGKVYSMMDVLKDI